MKLKSIKIVVNKNESIERTWEKLELRGPAEGDDLFTILDEAVNTIKARLGGLSVKEPDAISVLRLIESAGGTTTAEGLSCNGSWCAEQARAFLNTANKPGERPETRSEKP